ncbi:MAG: STAS/SEC14 domain-containing protein [Betaproteobacteria bacterium]
MIQPIPNLPAHVVGFAGFGQVDASDYETVFVPAIESALKAHGRIRVIYHLGPEFTGFTSGAMWEDMKLGFRHLASWERIAVVSDIDWVANAIRLFAFAIPCPVRVFSNAEFADALSWIAGD